MIKKIITILLILIVLISLILFFWPKRSYYFTPPTNASMCNCFGIEFDKAGGDKYCSGIRYNCTGYISPTTSKDKIKKYYQDIKQKIESHRFDMEIINLEEAYNFEEGIYYNYIGENTKGSVQYKGDKGDKGDTYNIDVELVINALINSNIPIQEAWYKSYSVSCYQTHQKGSVMRVLIIRLEDEFDLHKFGFEKVDNPDIGGCAYDIKHYNIKADSDGEPDLLGGDKFNYQAYLSRYGQHWCHRDEFNPEKIDGKLCQLYHIYTSDDFSQVEKEYYYKYRYHENISSDNKVEVKIKLKGNNNFIILEEYGVKKSQRKDSVYAEIYIDKLIELSKEKEIKFINVPSRPSLN